MFTKNCLKFLFAVVFRKKAKMYFYILFISLCYIMLFLAFSTTDTIFFVIDKNINNEISYRQFTMKINSEKNQEIEGKYIKYIKSIPQISNLKINKSNSEQIDSIDITIDDYNNLDHVITKLKYLDNCDIILNADYVVNLSLIRSIKYGSVIMLVVIILCTLCIVYIAMSNSINENTQDIMLYKAVGYNNKNLLLMILSENFIFSSISFIISIVIVNLLIKCVVNPFINLRKIGSLIGTKLGVHVGIYLSCIFIVTLVVIITSLMMLGKTKKISIIELLRE
jgi:ABC-type antimicrobial peptide transport system permease subunit